MPLANIPQIWWYPIIYMPLLLATFQVMCLMGANIDRVGLNLRSIKFQIIIALSGLVIGVLEYLILTEEARVTGQILGEAWLLSAFFLVICTGFIEEVGYKKQRRRGII
jgi:hypothetical protein